VVDRFAGQRVTAGWPERVGMRRDCGRTVRRAEPSDRDHLFDIWLRSARETHTFVSEEDWQSFEPLVRQYLASADTDFRVLCTAGGSLMGFMGLGPGTVESLFIAPEFHRRGGGRQLIELARELHGEITVDVNEQNAAAVRFYEACGFAVEGRSELDDNGRPYPLLHMRMLKSSNH
jgi:putative acetyltransferase